MKDKNIKKDETKGLENLKKLSEKDKTFISRLFSEYIGSRNITELDIKGLTKAMAMKYPDTYSSIISIVGNITVTDKEKILKDNKEVYEYFQELKSLYGPKMVGCFVVSRWPQGLRTVVCHTSIEPQDKESLHHITIHRIDGQTFTIYQPFSATMSLFIGIFRTINSSLKEMSDLKIQMKISKEDIETIEKYISEFRKYVKQIK